MTHMKPIFSPGFYVEYMYMTSEKKTLSLQFWRKHFELKENWSLVKRGKNIWLVFEVL